MLTRNFSNTIYSHLSNSALSLIKTDGTAFSGTPNNAILNVAAEIANDNFGLILGTNSAPAYFNDFNLNSRILEGSTFGLLNYLGTNFSSTNLPLPLNQIITIDRAVENNDTNNILIREIGLIMLIAPGEYVLLDHSLLYFDFIAGTAHTFTYTIYF